VSPIGSTEIDEKVLILGLGNFDRLVKVGDPAGTLFLCGRRRKASKQQTEGEHVFHDDVAAKPWPGCIV